MTEHKVVSREEWIAARKELSQLEEAYSSSYHDMVRQRTSLPWVKLTKDYLFDSPTGRVSLADLFDGRNQLIIQHFMLGPGWHEGCDGCSFMADHVPGTLPHLNNHGVTYVVVSRAPIAEIQVFQDRMGWPMTWVSSYGSDFNSDFNASYTQADIDAGKPLVYNYAESDELVTEEMEIHGLSSFYRDEDGAIYHTYSTYARGGDQMINAHNYLDLTPNGRNEKTTMDWLRLHDSYDAPEPVAATR
jgi:predicted dithiol-disulfide oxidoreductase (DUF899 family)